MIRDMGDGMYRLTCREVLPGRKHFNADTTNNKKRVGSWERFPGIGVVLEVCDGCQSVAWRDADLQGRLMRVKLAAKSAK